MTKYSRIMQESSRLLRQRSSNFEDVNKLIKNCGETKTRELYC